MAKALDSFNDFEQWKEEDDGSIIVATHPRLDIGYLTKRTMMFLSMTQGAGKPMTFGCQKKDKRDK